MNRRNKRLSLLTAVTTLGLALSVLIAPTAHASDLQEAVVMAPSSASIKFTSLRASNGETRVLVNRAVTARGTTSANLVGATVKVQRFTGTSWVLMSGSSVVRSDGTFAISSTVENVGKIRYRVVFSGSSTVTKAVSNELTLVTFRWRDANSLLKTNPSISPTLRLNGVDYANVPYFSRGGSEIAYDLRRSCEVFQANIGPVDTEAAGTSATIDYQIDGWSRMVRQIYVGGPLRLNSQVKGALELRFEYLENSLGSYRLKTAIAGARALCAF